MKYILKTPLFIMCFIIIIIIGCFLGNNISEDFTGLYVSKLMLIPIKYSLLSIVVIINFLVFNQQSRSVIVLRKKTLFDALIGILKIEVIILFILFLGLHFPILFSNPNKFTNYLNLMIKIVINSVIISIILITLIKIIDLKLKNRAISCSVILSSFCIIDLVLEHFNWFVVDNSIFDFSYIFILPYIYSNYFLIAFILIAIAFILTALYMFFGMKKDCFLRGSYDKES